MKKKVVTTQHDKLQAARLQVARTEVVRDKARDHYHTAKQSLKKLKQAARRARKEFKKAKKAMAEAKKQLAKTEKETLKPAAPKATKKKSAAPQKSKRRQLVKTLRPNVSAKSPAKPLAVSKTAVISPAPVSTTTSE